MKTAGRWPWKSESAKECVTTHLPNELALKMDGAEACYLYSTAGASATRQRVGGRGVRGEGFCARARLERTLVQILVVVANIQVRTLKTEVEKGSV